MWWLDLIGFNSVKDDISHFVRTHCRVVTEVTDVWLLTILFDHTLCFEVL